MIASWVLKKLKKDTGLEQTLVRQLLADFVAEVELSRTRRRWVRPTPASGLFDFQEES
jgi:hypothetical protein